MADQKGKKRAREDMMDYLLGDMSPEKKADFEKSMESDESLRMEVEPFATSMNTATDWLRADAPGVERVSELPIPTLEESPTIKTFHLPLLPYLRPILAAAAIFAIGFFVGQISRDAAPQKGGITSPETAIQPVSATPSRITVEPKTDSFIIADSERQDAIQEVAYAPAPTHITDENGRLIIETTLASSGSQAVWVIDGSFGFQERKQQPKDEI